MYDKTCRDLTEDKQGFTEWIVGGASDFVAGQFAHAVAWYEKRHSWYLEAKHYDPINEEESTWLAKKLTRPSPPEPDHHVMKYFDIEKEERLITTNSKRRPVILLRRSVSDWWNPANAAQHFDYWLCIPMFTYKKRRHPQDYVIRDQRLNNPDAFYVPSAHHGYPGVGADEAAARFQAVQMIRADRLEACKHMSDVSGSRMSRPFRLTDVALRILVYHFYRSMGILVELAGPEMEYSLFREGVGALIDAAVDDKQRSEV